MDEAAGPLLAAAQPPSYQGVAEIKQEGEQQLEVKDGSPVGPLQLERPKPVKYRAVFAALTIAQLVLFVPQVALGEGDGSLDPKWAILSGLGLLLFGTAAVMAYMTGHAAALFQHFAPPPWCFAAGAAVANGVEYALMVVNDKQLHLANPSPMNPSAVFLDSFSLARGLWMAFGVCFSLAVWLVPFRGNRFLQALEGFSALTTLLVFLVCCQWGDWASLLVCTHVFHVAFLLLFRHDSWRSVIALNLVDGFALVCLLVIASPSYITLGVMVFKVLKLAVALSAGFLVKGRPEGRERLGWLALLGLCILHLLRIYHVFDFNTSWMAVWTGVPVVFFSCLLALALLYPEGGGRVLAAIAVSLAVLADGGLYLYWPSAFEDTYISTTLWYSLEAGLCLTSSIVFTVFSNDSKIYVLLDWASGFALFALIQFSPMQSSPALECLRAALLFAVLDMFVIKLVCYSCSSRRKAERLRGHLRNIVEVGALGALALARASGDWIPGCIALVLVFKVAFATYRPKLRPGSRACSEKVVLLMLTAICVLQNERLFNVLMYEEPGNLFPTLYALGVVLVIMGMYAALWAWRDVYVERENAAANNKLYSRCLFILSAVLLTEGCMSVRKWEGLAYDRYPLSQSLLVALVLAARAVKQQSPGTRASKLHVLFDWCLFYGMAAFLHENPNVSNFDVLFGLMVGLMSIAFIFDSFLSERRPWYTVPRALAELAVIGVLRSNEGIFAHALLVGCMAKVAFALAYVNFPHQSPQTKTLKLVGFLGCVISAATCWRVFLGLDDPNPDVALYQIIWGCGILYLALTAAGCTMTQNRVIPPLIGIAACVFVLSLVAVVEAGIYGYGLMHDMSFPLVELAFLPYGAPQVWHISALGLCSLGVVVAGAYREPSLSFRFQLIGELISMGITICVVSWRPTLTGWDFVPYVLFGAGIITVLFNIPGKLALFFLGATRSNVKLLSAGVSLWGDTPILLVLLYGRPFYRGWPGMLAVGVLILKMAKSLCFSPLRLQLSEPVNNPPDKERTVKIGVSVLAGVFQLFLLEWLMYQSQEVEGDLIPVQFGLVTATVVGVLLATSLLGTVDHRSPAPNADAGQSWIGNAGRARGAQSGGEGLLGTYLTVVVLGILTAQVLYALLCFADPRDLNPVSGSAIVLDMVLGNGGIMIVGVLCAWWQSKFRGVAFLHLACELASLGAHGVLIRFSLLPLPLDWTQFAPSYSLLLLLALRLILFVVAMPLVSHLLTKRQLWYYFFLDVCLSGPLLGLLWWQSQPITPPLEWIFAAALTTSLAVVFSFCRVCCCRNQADELEEETQAQMRRLDQAQLEQERRLRFNARYVYRRGHENNPNPVFGLFAASEPQDESKHPQAEEKEDCGICLSAPGELSFTKNACPHFFCRDCIQRAFTDILDNGRFPARCPSCRAERATLAEGEDDGSSVPEDVPQLLAQEGVITQEVAKRFIRHQLMSAGHSEDRLIKCPECPAVYLLDATLNVATLVRCGACDIQFCRVCEVRWHTGVTCEQFRQRRTGDDPATLRYIQQSSKPCPFCGIRVTHWRYHACHHIKPGTGCPNCHQHFCYSCSGPWPCQRGCALFCTETCGCPICPDCKPGRPCPLCSEQGGCPQCRVR